MKKELAAAKLSALRTSIAASLKKGWGFSDPRLLLDLFTRYWPIRDALRTEHPDEFDDLPVREDPVTKSSDNEGRGFIARPHLEALNRDVEYTLQLLEASSANQSPSLKVTREGMFFSGQYYDALSKVSEIVSAAKSKIVVVDGYIDERVLNLMTQKPTNATVLILTRSVSRSLGTAAVAFNKQYGGLEIRTSTAFHDRFLIIDDTDYYHFGASLKDVGNRGSMFSLIEEAEVRSTLAAKLATEWSNAKPEVTP